MLTPITPDRLAAVRQAAAEAERDRPAAPLANRERVEALTATRTLEWGGRLYDVPPVPYLQGLRLQTLLRRLLDPAAKERSWEEQSRELKEILGESVAVFRLVVRPRSRWRRWLWPFLPNPFRDASEREVGYLLSFFNLCRTSSRVPRP